MQVNDSLDISELNLDFLVRRTPGRFGCSLGILKTKLKLTSRSPFLIKHLTPRVPTASFEFLLFNGIFMSCGYCLEYAVVYTEIILKKHNEQYRLSEAVIQHDYSSSASHVCTTTLWSLDINAQLEETLFTLCSHCIWYFNHFCTRE